MSELPIMTSNIDIDMVYYSTIIWICHSLVTSLTVTVAELKNIIYHNIIISSKSHISHGVKQGGCLSDFHPHYIFFERKTLLETQQKQHYLHIHICTSHHQLHIQTLYTIQNEVLTMVKKHLPNGQLSRKVVQLIHVGCPRLMHMI